MADKFNQSAYIAAYNKQNYANVNLKIPKDIKARWEMQAKAAGLSLTAWLSEKAAEPVSGWSYILVKGDIEEAFESASDYHFRVFGCAEPAEMVDAIKRIDASNEEFYILENEDADTIDNFFNRYEEG